jgi:microcystin-dependent protein
MWTGVTIPDGWALCDGTNGTPNLIDKFIMGGTTATVGQQGGSSTVTLVSANLPPHSHGVLVGPQTGVVNGLPGLVGAATITTDTRNAGTVYSDSSSGSSQPISIIPSYYKLVYIMKL